MFIFSMALNDTIRRMEETGCDMANSIKEDVRESKHGKLKLLALEALPVAMGVTFSGIGRATGNPELIAVPPIMDLFFGALPSRSPRAVGRMLYGYTKYAIGAALPYADRIYMAAQSLSDKF
jgi:hypothetical protein